MLLTLKFCGKKNSKPSRKRAPPIKITWLKRTADQPCRSLRRQQLNNAEHSKQARNVDNKRGMMANNRQDFEHGFWATCTICCCVWRKVCGYKTRNFIRFVEVCCILILFKDFPHDFEKKSISICVFYKYSNAVATIFISLKE